MITFIFGQCRAVDLSHVTTFVLTTNNKTIITTDKIIGNMIFMNARSRVARDCMCLIVLSHWLNTDCCLYFLWAKHIALIRPNTHANCHWLRWTAKQKIKLLSIRWARDWKNTLFECVRIRCKSSAEGELIPASESLGNIIRAEFMSGNIHGQLGSTQNTKRNKIRQTYKKCPFFSGLHFRFVRTCVNQ